MKDDRQNLRFIDLFGGIGGFRLGIERADRLHSEECQKRQESNIGQRGGAVAPSEKRHPQFVCTWYCDVDKHAASVYNKNFGEGWEPADVKGVDAGGVPDHDVLCAGFPCQSFSIAGKRGGFEDTRGTLFFDICRIAKGKRTPHLFLENVKGLLSHDGGKTFGTILSTLDELGYDCQWQVLNSKHFGVPQNRERVFIVASLRGEPRPEIFPLEEDDAKPDSMAGEAEGGGEGVGREDTAPALRGGDKWNSFVAVPEKAGSSQVILHNLYGGFDESKPRLFEDYSPTIRTPKGGGHIPSVLAFASRSWPRTGTKEEDGERHQNIEPRDDGCTNALTGVEKDNYLMIRDGRDNRSYLRSGRVPELGIEGASLRRLTPVECERLQGYPDCWTKEGINGKGEIVQISDSQRYKMCGNAVTVNVIEAIARRWIEWMSSQKSRDPA